MLTSVLSKMIVRVFRRYCTVIPSAPKPMKVAENTKSWRHLPKNILANQSAMYSL